MTGAELRRQLGIKDSPPKKNKKFKKKHREDNEKFGRLFGPIIGKFWGKFKKMRTPEGKIALLVEMSKVRLPNPNPYAIRRAKYKKRVGHCAVCADFGFHNHHIVGVNNGGPSSKSNLMVLCEGCHRAIHPWMPSSLPEEPGMKETMERVSRESL
jgi:hypothetical protein